ncbi:MAG TPA: hypothetical protein VJU87_01325 [Gemmatimonadaceae bacterium]|nr:hypothetical protein [Gemmatimonadaceae bacterium]
MRRTLRSADRWGGPTIDDPGYARPPWPRGEPAISNGLGLCKIHHSAYDANIIGIDADSHVHVREDVLGEIDGPMLQYGLKAVHDSRLLLPRRVEQHPNRDFLAERFEQFRAA